jgi:membrane associated rhomboid family serine protease
VSEPRADDYDLKQCGRCAAWIPRTATMCAYCGTSTPDARIDPRPRKTPLGLPRYVTVTRALIAANLAWFVLSCWVQRADTTTHFGKFLVEGATGTGRPPVGLWALGWYDHARVFEGGEWWRVVTATFLHAGVIHLALNMFALHQLGQIAEELFGGAKLLAIYLVCGACSALAVTVWYVGILKQDPTRLVGASGAIFGVGGLLAAFLLRRGSERGRAIGKQIGQNLLVMLALGFFLHFVSNTGHVGGLIPGLLFGMVVRERFSTLLSPESRRNWWIAAALASLAAVVALGSAAAFAVRFLREIP